MSPWLVLRPSLDRLVAALLIILLSPLIVLLALLVRRQDGEPGLIKLERVGRNGRSFHMWKLRTMNVTSGRPTAPITIAEDPRITRLGVRLRKYRLDELPQLFNVVLGDMTLIGPRPETPEFVDTNDESWRAALRVRPGIAGPAQAVVHRWEARALRGEEWHRCYSEEILPVKLAIDGWYVERASPWLDALIIASIASQILGGRERTALHRRVESDVTARRPSGAAGTGGPEPELAPDVAG